MCTFISHFGWTPLDATILLVLVNLVFPCALLQLSRPNKVAFAKESENSTLKQQGMMKGRKENDKLWEPKELRRERVEKGKGKRGAAHFWGWEIEQGKTREEGRKGQVL